MYLVLILLAVPNLSTCSSSTPNRTIGRNKYLTFTFPPTPKISDDELMIKDFSTFVHNYSLHETLPTNMEYNLTVNASRRYYESPINSPWTYHNRLFQLMKQSLYAAQDRLQHLQGLVEKYQYDPSFRAGYIFRKLDELLKDMRKIMSHAIRQWGRKSILKNIIFYKHLTRRNVDITYIVEFLYDFYRRHLEKFEKALKEGGGLRALFFDKL